MSLMRVSNGSDADGRSIAEPSEKAESPGEREDDARHWIDARVRGADHEPGPFYRSGTADPSRTEVEP